MHPLGLLLDASQKRHLVYEGAIQLSTFDEIAWYAWWDFDKANFTNHKEGSSSQKAVMIFRLYKTRSISVRYKPQQFFKCHDAKQTAFLALGPDLSSTMRMTTDYLSHPRNSSPVTHLPEVLNRIHRNPTTKVARCEKGKGTALPPWCFKGLLRVVRCCRFRSELMGIFSNLFKPLWLGRG